MVSHGVYSSVELNKGQVNKVQMSNTDSKPNCLRYEVMCSPIWPEKWNKHI